MNTSGLLVAAEGGNGFWIPADFNEVIWNSTAFSSGLRPDGSRTNGILSSIAATVASGFRSAAPTRALTSAAATRKIAAAA